MPAFPAYHWQTVAQPPGAAVERVAARFALSRPAAAILLTRAGSEEACEAFLSPALSRLTSPRALPGVDAAAVRIVAALLRKETITVFGDYDADGVTATALMVSVLKQLGATVFPFIPDRVTEGYGLSEAALARCIANTRPRLLVTVDCGITSAETCRALAAKGIDVVLTDHHMPGETLPEACALVNPRVAASPGAEALCGCGVAFKVAYAVVRFAALAGMEAARNIRLRSMLDLVALATVADVVELTGENRILVAEGLRLLNPPARPGFKALARRCCKPGGDVSSTSLAFGLGPRLNAAGRMGQIRTAYRLLITESPEQAEADAEALETHNADRRAVEQRMFEQICAEHALTSAASWEKAAIVAGGHDFHPGVVGVVAARLMERAGVPAAVIVRDAHGGGHGSMRAFAPYHAVEALEACRELLEGFGGHPAAAGFTIKAGGFTAFCEALCAAFARQTGAAPRPSPALMVDAWLDPSDVSCSLCRELLRLEPFGEGNRRPVLALRGVEVGHARAVGAEGRHAQLRFNLANGESVKAIWFSAADHLPALQNGGRFDVAFHLEEDAFTGEPVPSLSVSALRATPGETHD